MSSLLLRFTHSAPEITALAADVAAKFRNVYDVAASVPADKATFATVIQPIGDAWASLSAASEYCQFPRHMSPIKAVRDASAEACKMLSALNVELGMRVDVYNAVLAVSKKNEALEPEQRRYLDRMLRDFRRNGLHLPEDQRAEIKKIQEEISELAIKFSTNLTEIKTKLPFTKEQLEGLDEDFINSLTKSEDGTHLLISLSYPHYFPCMKKAVRPETRKTLEAAFQSRGIVENTPLMQRILILRQRQAEILGYKTHAHYITETRMAKSPERVREFLTSLNEKLTPLAQAELQELLTLKKEECARRGYEFDSRINGWDFRYYAQQIEEKRFQVDHNELMQYFPMPVVTKGLLAIYEKVFSITFEKVNVPAATAAASAAADANSADIPPANGIWHPEVLVYNVRDTATQEIFGQFFLDLHPREGKYGHAACFGLQPGCELPGGQRQIAVAAMLANFTAPTKDQPALMLHDEVETYFHELGHVLHQLLARTKYAMFSGTRVERDFVECPSQILENWCWEKESLHMMSQHHQTGAKIPEALLDRLLASRKANAGLFNKRQVLLATFDQTIHTVMGGQTIDVANVFAELAKSIWGIEVTPGTSMPASFEHLVGGYDSQYYGYLWSEVYSADIFFSRFQPEGILNSETGRAYRTSILQPGGSRDAWDMVVEFLGREPNDAAFLKSKGL
ncbi:thimet oligopeptidase 1 [Capsaspora owczarzaki ATCC 30864]|uniref:Thimet oligopeptidase 1 n=1 Tax=Capsaspora owczarzaki (strain ATCC 30864) TaxID=595528 RepID=A0A0D2X4Z9_CAPO3|nr:thimet oligopeptidase 1 [Capsaspora owczarzaki ATCC 30864]KJE96939.1 thimet oligopeptidase 1 [Capsaspora owczarzaki ATCC 30864]|eukprot:XP_004343907.1 thimet oligopeptidase 1 [Capsaspora owczarzaki ATCC 30864]